MKGSIFLLFLILIFSADRSCRCQQLEPVIRKTCIEIFTATWCGPCHFAERDFRTNVLPNIDNYTIIEYHQGQDVYATWEGHQRFGYYGLSYVPDFIYDGYVDSLAYTPSIEKFQNCQQELSNTKITILNAYHDDFESQVNVTGVIFPMITYSDSYTLRVVVTERNRPQSNADSLYNIQVKMSPSEVGTPLSKLNSRVPIYFNQSIPVYSSQVQSMENLRVVVFIQNDVTHKIEQSEWQDVNISNGLPFPYSEEPEPSLSPNPANAFVTIHNIKPESKIKVFDAMGKCFNIPESIDDDSRNLNTASLADGVYFISLDNRKTFKFVKYE